LSVEIFEFEIRDAFSLRGAGDETEEQSSTDPTKLQHRCWEVYSIREAARLHQKVESLMS